MEKVLHSISWACRAGANDAVGKSQRPVVAKTIEQIVSKRVRRIMVRYLTKMREGELS